MLVSATTYVGLELTVLGALIALTGFAGLVVARAALVIAVLLLLRALSDGLADQAVPFVAGAYIWIFIHGLFMLLAARLLRIDIHTAAIASAANIGGAASAPIVASFHDERLVPVSILMALIGYAIGNYAAFLAAWLCSIV